MQWIKASALNTWAETQIGRAEIARLVERLIWASVNTIQSVRFPAGDAGQVPGFDGHLIADESVVHPFVPAGESIWEFGADKRYTEKAEQDYKKRTDDFGSAQASKCTFVFVTPRIRKSLKPSLTNWERAKRSEGKWKNVVALDGVKLEHWLDRCEATAKGFAQEVTGLGDVDGIRTVNEFWDEYASRFDPKLIEEVILCNRNKEADDLLGRLTSGVPQSIKLQADSRNEVVAFVCAAIRKSEAAVAHYLKSRTLVLDTRVAAERRINSPNLIFIPRDSATDLAGLLSYQNPTIIPMGRIDPLATSLPRPSSYELSQALKSMSLEDARAELIARTCGRSVTILARRIPRVERPQPPWSSSPGLLAALMAGAWDDGFEGDRFALSTLAGKSFEEFDRGIRVLLSLPEPLEREGSVFKIRAPLDYFVELGPLFTRYDFERLQKVFVEVFGEVDPALDLPISERRYASIRGIKRRHSDWLRDGLATTLLQIAVLHQEARVQISGINPEFFVNQLLESLPGLRDDARLMISLGRQLPWLMEAAPGPLLSALEHLLEGDGKKIMPIFEEDDSLFSQSLHTHVLWALEALAWNPAFLTRAALNLAALARLDPGGHLANRPSSSLQSIFKAWLPQTKASLSERLTVIDLIRQQEPEISWDLVLSLLPTQHSSGSYNPKPLLRESDLEPQEILTTGLLYQTYSELIDRAILMARGSMERLLKLLRTMDAFRPSDMERVCDALQELIPVISADQRFALWSELRDFVSMQATYSHARWALPPKVTGRLRSLKGQLDPPDILLRVRWLFDKHYPDLGAPMDEEISAMVEAERSAAIATISSTLGNQGLIDLARGAKIPSTVAISVGNLATEPGALDDLVETSLKSGGVPDEFFLALSSVGFSRFGRQWSEYVLRRARNGLAPNDVATLLLGWSEEREAWNLADSLNAEVVRCYWSRRRAWPIKGSVIDQMRAANEYLKVERALSALSIVEDAADVLPWELMAVILASAVKEISKASAPLDGNFGYKIGRVFDALASRVDIDQAELAMLEYAYLPILKHRDSTLTLHRFMVQDATFFVSIICDVFRSASHDDKEPTEEQKNKAKYAYDLLSSLTLVPGFGQVVDQSHLRNWVRDVRLSAKEHGRSEIAERYIGQVLAHAPEDPSDHAWPHEIVRNLLEELKSPGIERGIITGRSNMGGAHFIDPKHPGAIQSDRAARAREWAKATRRWSRTANMLDAMATDWDHLAKAMEERGRQEAMRD